MGKDKSILDKVTDTVKGVASTPRDTLKPDEPAAKADERMADYMPLAAEGLVHEPAMAPPAAVARPRKRRAAPKRAARVGRAAAAKKSARKRSASKAAKKSASKRSAKAAKKTAKKTKKAKKKSRR
jgi:hypothetical protein